MQGRRCAQPRAGGRSRGLSPAEQTGTGWDGTAGDTPAAPQAGGSQRSTVRGAGGVGGGGWCVGWAPEGCRGHIPASAQPAALHLQGRPKRRAERLCKTSKQSAATGEHKRQAERQAGAGEAQPAPAPSARYGG